MSGFVAVVGRNGRQVSQACISELTGTLGRRGPDGQQTIIAGSAGFGCALLRIADRDTGIARLSDHLWIAGDIRLVGRQDLLRRFSAAERTQLAESPDAELVLAAYDRWGVQCTEHLQGEFSFLIWDVRNGRICCARDQFGVRPCFYALTAGYLIVSNTLECVRSHPGVGSALDELAVADYLLYGRAQDPAATVFSQIRRLPAGHMLTCELGGAPAVRRYWTLPVPEPLRYRKPAGYVEQFRDLLRIAVADRMPAGRAGVLMSGGVDSTMVAAAARQNGAQLRAFTVVEDRRCEDTERHYAGLAAAAMQIPIEYLQGDGHQLFSGPADPSLRNPEPIDAPLLGIFNDQMRRASEFAPLALSGYGGDPLLFPSPDLAATMLRNAQVRELAAGVSQFIRMRGSFPPLGLRGVLKRGIGLGRQTARLNYPEWLNPEIEGRLGLRERWTNYQVTPVPDAHPLRPRAYAMLTDSFWPSLFDAYDAGCTGFPVAVSHPLFDLRLVEYCLSIPPIPWFIDKTLARVAMSGWLPEEVRLRPKTPLAYDPVADRLRESSWVDDWKSTAEIDRFIVRSRIPKLSSTDGVDCWLNLRPFSLKCWLNNLTQCSSEDTKEKYAYR